MSKNEIKPEEEDEEMQITDSIKTGDKKNKIVRKFKLEPIIKKKLINDESNTFDLRKNKSYINTNIRNRMNESN